MAAFSTKLKSQRLAFFILHASFFILVLFFWSCTKSTENKYASLSGNVVLYNDTANAGLDAADNAGVTVALYRLAALEGELTVLNNSHPNLGVKINQQTEFDHRLQSPVATTTTTATGAFSFSKISPGNYNLVVFKQGWGVRYFYDQSLDEGANEVDQANQRNGSSQLRSDIYLYPATDLTGFPPGSLNCLAGHSYIVSNNATLSNAATFNAGSYIWIAPARSLKFLSTVATPSDTLDYVRISTSDAMYSTTIHNSNGADSLQRFYKLNCETFGGFGQNRLKAIVTTQSTLGWSIKTTGLAASNLVFKYDGLGIFFIDQSADISIDRCLVQRCNDNQLGGISFAGCTNAATTNVIFINNKIGIRQLSTSNANVTNCYFSHNTTSDVYNLYETTGTVTQCTFTSSQLAISNSGLSNTTITYCDINGVNGISNYIQQNFGPAYFTANNNNLVCSGIAARTVAVFDTPYPYTITHLDAKNNYWGVITSAEIDALIFDMHDMDPENPDYHRYLGEINYVPFKAARVTNAGII